MNELRDMMHLPTESEREEQKIMDRIDAVVVARDKRIAELEAENKQLKGLVAGMQQLDPDIKTALEQGE